MKELVYSSSPKAPHVDRSHKNMRGLNFHLAVHPALEKTGRLHSPLFAIAATGRAVPVCVLHYVIDSERWTELRQNTWLGLYSHFRLFFSLSARLSASSSVHSFIFHQLIDILLPIWISQSVCVYIDFAIHPPICLALYCSIYISPNVMFLKKQPKPHQAFVAIVHHTLKFLIMNSFLLFCVDYSSTNGLPEEERDHCFCRGSIQPVLYLDGCQV